MEEERRGSRPIRVLTQRQSLTPLELLRAPGSRDGNVDGNLILPHTLEAGDPYYIGDVYDSYPTECAQEWELLDGVQRPYLSFIKDVSSAWPHLRYLADWMQVTTSPAKWKHIKDRESTIRAERAIRTHVAIADLTPTTGVSVRTVTATSDLDVILREHSNDQLVHTHRLYIVEDLSRDVIEMLGSRLDVDPLVFREQISDYMWYNTRDPWVELPDLKVVSKKRNSVHFRYLRPRYFRTEESYGGAVHQAGFFNVLRRLDTDRHHRTAWDADGSCVGLARSRTSFWWRPAVPGEHGTIGVLLVDPTIKEGYPLWAGYRNFQPTPSFSSTGPFKAPPHTSLFDAVVYWYQQITSSQAREVAMDPRTMLVPVCQIICAEWLTVGRYITGRLNQIEWELENPHFRRDPNGIDASLSKLHPLRRSVPLYIEMVRETIAKLFPDDDDGGGGVHLSEGVRALRADFAQVERNTEELQDRIERIVAVATAIISIEDSRRDMRLNLYLGRLSYVAVLFAPLSFISSLYSVAPDLAQLSQTLWIFFVTAVPFTALAVLVVDHAYVWAWCKRHFGRRKRKVQ